MMTATEKPKLNYKVKIVEKPEFKRGKYGPYFSCRVASKIRDKKVEFTLMGFYSLDKRTKSQTPANKALFDLFKKAKEGDTLTVFGNPVRFKTENEKGKQVSGIFFRVLSARKNLEREMARSSREEIDDIPY